MGTLCRHVPRVFRMAITALLVAANYERLLPGSVQTLFEVLVLLLSLVDVYVLQSHLESRAFTVTLMSMEIVEATLSSILLLPNTGGLSREFISNYLLVNNAFDVVGGIYYEWWSHKLRLCIADGPVAHPVLRYLVRMDVRFGLILLSLFKLASLVSTSYDVIPTALAYALALIFVFVGVGQVLVASLTAGNSCCCCCWCFRLVRPTNGKIRGYLPVAVLGFCVEGQGLWAIFSCGDPDARTAYRVLMGVWSFFLTVNIVQFLETSALYRTFSVPFCVAEPSAGRMPVALGLSVPDEEARAPVSAKAVSQAAVTKDPWSAGSEAGSGFAGVRVEAVMVPDAEEGTMSENAV